jgi:methionyl-tRNA formyltransferase
VLSKDFWSALVRAGASEAECISSPEELEEICNSLAPGSRIFFPHWNWIIPRDVYAKFECVMFHMTDLPFGRGGSPLQNMLLLGMEDTVISAFRCDEGLDSGPVYSKVPLSLEGSAHEIFKRADIAISNQILQIHETEPEPSPQVGKPTFFARRKPCQSEIGDSLDIRGVHNLIRALDAPGYRPANLKHGTLTYFFSEAEWFDGEIMARVTIKQENE